MPWVESNSVIGRHRKIKGLARQLAIGIPQAVGHLHLLWHAVIEQAEDGDLSKWNAYAVAECAMWDGDAPALLLALQENGLMDGMRVHDWLDYAAIYLVTKYKTRNQQKLIEIWAKFGKVYGRGNAQDIPAGSTQGSDREVLPNQPNLTNQPKTADKSASFPREVPIKSESVESQEQEADPESASLNSLLSRPKKEKSAQRTKTEVTTFTHPWLQNEMFLAAWDGWLQNRKKKASEYAKKLAMDILQDLSGGDMDDAMEYVKYSAIGGYPSFYARKGQGQAATSSRNKYGFV